MTIIAANYFANIGTADAIACVGLYSFPRSSSTSSGLPGGWTSESAAASLPLWSILVEDRAALRSRGGKGPAISTAEQRAEYVGAFLKAAALEAARIYRARHAL